MGLCWKLLGRTRQWKDFFQETNGTSSPLQNGVYSAAGVMWVG